MEMGGGRTHALSPASSRLSLWTAMFSRPARKDSREREMWPSWEFGSRFREMARCRSRRESLMWSARRKSWFGFDMAGMLYDFYVNSVWCLGKANSQKGPILLLQFINSLGTNNSPVENKTASESENDPNDGLVFETARQPGLVLWK